MGHSLKIILPVFILFLFSCKKDHSILGTDVQPSIDGLNAQYLPNLPVTAHTLPYDSVAAYNDAYKYIGSNNDPHFGRADIGLYLNANFTKTDVNFGATSVLKYAEIVLAIDPLQYMGDKDATLTYSIYPILEKLDPKKVYYTSNTRIHEPNPISISSGKFSLDTASGKAVIRIPIDAAYATSLLHDTPNLVNNETFQNKYKGYYIATGIGSGSEGVIFKANLDDAVSGFYLNYKSTTVTDTVFKFSFTGATASKYSTVKFEPIQSLKNQFQDSSLGASNLYLKGMGMTRLKIQIPFLKNYSDSFQVAVNRAELILNVDPAFVTSGRYLPPGQLTLLSIDQDGRETYLTDLLNVTNYARYNGKYDETNKRYVFNLAREAQLILAGLKKNNGFYLVVANTDVSVKTEYATGSSKELLPVRRDNYIERIILAGSNNSALKPIFNLNYVRFKND